MANEGLLASPEAMWDMDTLPGGGDTSDTRPRLGTGGSLGGFTAPLDALLVRGERINSRSGQNGPIF